MRRILILPTALVLSALALTGCAASSNESASDSGGISAPEVEYQASEGGDAAVSDMVEVLARHDPILSKTTLEATGKVFAALSVATAQLSIEQQRHIVTDANRFVRALEVSFSGSLAQPTDALLDRQIETLSQGVGVGYCWTPTKIDDTLRRLKSIARQDVEKV